MTFNAVSETAVLTVNPPSTLSLYSLTIEPRNVVGGSGAVGKVVLTGPAPNGGVDVLLTSSDIATVTVPTKVRVKGSEISASFDITTRAVTGQVGVTISGQYGELTQSDVLTVIPPTAIRLVSLTLSPSTVVGGSPVTGLVTIDMPAPAGGIVVSLSPKPKKKLVMVPAAVLIPENATTGTFTIATATVRRVDAAEIRASFAGVTRTATLTVTPATAVLLERWRMWRAQSAVRRAAGTSIPLSLSVTAPVAASSLPAGTPRRISLYSPELNLMAETETSTATTPAIAYEYVWFGGQPVAQIETASAQIHYYFNDHLGTPVLTTDATRAVDWRVQREPYGAIVATRTGAERHQPLAFPGQEGGEELSYNIFRWYRTGWGRYTQPDKQHILRVLAPYRYGLSNPVRWSDRLGTAPDTLCVANWSLMFGTMGAVATGTALAGVGGSVTFGVLTIPSGALGALLGAASGATVGTIVGNTVCPEKKTCPAPPPPIPVTCAKTGEDLTESDMGVKKCMYQCTDGSTFTILINVGSQCPSEFVK